MGILPLGSSESDPDEILILSMSAFGLVPKGLADSESNDGPWEESPMELDSELDDLANHEMSLGRGFISLVRGGSCNLLRAFDNMDKAEPSPSLTFSAVEVKGWCRGSTLPKVIQEDSDSEGEEITKGKRKVVAEDTHQRKRKEDNEEDEEDVTPLERARQWANLKVPAPPPKDCIEVEDKCAWCMNSVRR